MQSESQPAGEQNEDLLEIEREMQRIESPLPEAPVSEFSSPMLPLLFSPHLIRPAVARELFLKAFAADGQALPKGTSADHLVETSRPVFVPRWFIGGDIAGKWSATGIETESWEVDCPNCFGSGKVGSGSQKRQCESCWGSGKEKQSRKSKRPESGDASAVVRESLDNNGCGVSLGQALDLDLGIDPLFLPEDAKARLRCLRPATVYPSAASDTLKNRLAAAIEEQAKSGLKRYSRIDGFQFEGETIKSQSTVAVWLYPAYICGFEVNGAKQFAVCDGLTGKVVLRLGTAPAASASSTASAAQVSQAAKSVDAARSSAPQSASASGNGGHVAGYEAAAAGKGSSSKLPIIAIILLLLALAVGAWYFLKPGGSGPAASGKSTTSASADAGKP